MKSLVVCALLLAFAVTMVLSGSTVAPTTTAATTAATTHAMAETTHHDSAGQVQPLVLLVLLPAFLYRLL
jgi:uncharacterized protein YceK